MKKNFTEDGISFLLGALFGAGVLALVSLVYYAYLIGIGGL